MNMALKGQEGLSTKHYANNYDLSFYCDKAYDEQECGFSKQAQSQV